MAEGSDMNEMIKPEEGDNPYMGDWSGQSFVLLLKVTISNGKPLPIGGFTGRAISQMLHEVVEVVPKQVVIVNDQEVLMELEEETSIMDAGLCPVWCYIFLCLIN